MKFDLTTPCANCPFRTDITPFITAERCHEITDALTNGDATFTCHKTTVPSEDADGDDEMVDGPNAQHCAGALIMLEKMEQPNQMMRWMERIGDYDRTKLDMAAPVYEDADEMNFQHEMAERERGGWNARPRAKQKCKCKAKRGKRHK